MRKPEIGCGLSHKKAWKYIIDNNLPNALIIEDDIVINNYINEYYSGRYVFTVTADRFLRNMVRAMVGSLIEVGSGKRNPEWIAEMLSAKNRSSAGNSVPGHALFLTNIRY